MNEDKIIKLLTIIKKELNNYIRKEIEEEDINDIVLNFLSNFVAEIFLSFNNIDDETFNHTINRVFKNSLEIYRINKEKVATLQ